MTKKIEAIIREERLEAVKVALTEIGIVGLNIFQVRGRGRDGGIRIETRNGSYMVDMIPKIQVNIVLSDDNVETTIEAISKAASTGDKGDGVIFVLPVDDVVRISTGERGRAAITYQGDIDSQRMPA
ncbi:MAG: P-II family nitrogen regulator [Anaerolineae bacterium]|nr:P-II family nitrogen regulator [Anaerolineae bacterium]